MKIGDKETVTAEALRIQKQSEALVQKPNQNATTAQGATGTQGDTVSISSRSLASELAAQMDSESAEKVKRLKELYQAGELKPADSQTLAQALIENGSEEVDFLKTVAGDETA